MIEQAATITEDILEGAGVPKANILVEQLKAQLQKDARETEEWLEIWTK